MTPGASDVLFQGYLPAAQADLYEVPTSYGNGRVEIDAVWLCNTNAGSIPVTLLYGTGALTKANSLFWAAPFAANNTQIVFGGAPVNFKGGFKFAGNAGGGTDVVMTVFGRVILE